MFIIKKVFPLFNGTGLSAIVMDLALKKIRKASDFVLEVATMPLLFDLIEVSFLLYFVFQDLETQQLSLRALLLFGLTEYGLAFVNACLFASPATRYSAAAHVHETTLCEPGTDYNLCVLLSAVENSLGARFSEILSACFSFFLLQLFLLITVSVLLFLAEKWRGHFLLGAADLLLPLLLLPRLGLKKALLLFPLASSLSLPAFILLYVRMSQIGAKSLAEAHLPLYPFYFCALLCLRFCMI